MFCRRKHRMRFASGCESAVRRARQYRDARRHDCELKHLHSARSRTAKWDSPACAAGLHPTHATSRAPRKDPPVARAPSTTCKTHRAVLLSVACARNSCLSPGRRMASRRNVNVFGNKGYEDRYSASVARAEALLDATASYGRFVNDEAFSEGGSRDFSDMTSPAPSEGTMSRAEDASPLPGGDAGEERARKPATLVPPPRRVKTSEDARAGSSLARTCGCSTPFRGYSSLLSYVVGFGWLFDAIGSTPENAANMRIRRSMSSRIAVEALQDNDDDDDEQ